MSNYEYGTIYNGNIMKVENGKSLLFMENEKLMYNEIEDTFFPLYSTLNKTSKTPFVIYAELLLEADNMSNKKRDNLTKEFMDNNIKYGTDGNEGEYYVDINSIVKNEIEAYANKRGR